MKYIYSDLGLDISKHEIYIQRPIGLDISKHEIYIQRPRTRYK